MRKNSLSNLPPFVRYMVVSGSSLIFASVCAVIMGAVAMASSDPTKNLTLYGEIIFILSMFFCGFLGAKTAVDAKFLCGILSATLMLLVVIAASLALGGNLVPKVMLIAGIGIVAALSGAVIGSREKKRRRKR